MTGTAHRPERGSLETPAATQRDTTSARQALKHLHVAEQLLLSAQKRAETARIAAVVALELETTSSSRRRSLKAHYAGKRSALSPHLSVQDRAAALARLDAEEHAADQALDIELKANAAALRAQRLIPITNRYRTERRAISERQRRERTAIALRRRSLHRRPTTMARPAVRAVAHALHRRHKSKPPSPAPQR